MIVALLDLATMGLAPTLVLQTFDITEIAVGNVLEAGLVGNRV